MNQFQFLNKQRVAPFTEKKASRIRPEVGIDLRARLAVEGQDGLLQLRRRACGVRHVYRHAEHSRSASKHVCPQDSSAHS